MPLSTSKRVLADFNAYCSAPPLKTSSRLLLPPRPTRAEQARRPCASLRAVKAEFRESEVDSMEFVIDDEDADDKPEVGSIKIEPDPRQLIARVAAIETRQPASTASTSSEEAQGPSLYRTQPLCRVPPCQLGPADPPRRPGRPKGSKSRLRIATMQGLPVPSMRAAAAKAIADMT